MAKQLEIFGDSGLSLPASPTTALTEPSATEAVEVDVPASVGTSIDATTAPLISAPLDAETLADTLPLKEPLSEVIAGAMLDGDSNWVLAEPPSDTQRIHQLEQALRQCQLYIDELKQTLVDQSFLEEQLATTESFSHIQKQAIEALKIQVADTQALQAEFTLVQQQLEILQTRHRDTEAIAQTLETEHIALKQQLQQNEAERVQLRDKNVQVTAQLNILQSSIVQETQQRIIAQKTADRLRADLRRQEVVIQGLEEKIRQSDGLVQQREDIIATLQNLSQPDSQKNQFIQGMSATLLKAQRRIAELENDLSSQTIVQAQLQHTTQELEQDAQSSQSRVDQLETQVHELQEQVLRQAQQASEYETAVQHWKTRCREAEDWTQRLAKAWDTLDSDARRPSTISPELDQALSDLANWLSGNPHRSPEGIPALSPKELLRFRSR